jgi:hypothetical protein
MEDAQLKDLLKKIDAKELREFILVHAALNSDFKTEVQVYFSDQDDQIDLVANYRSLVHGIIGKYGDRGYITYRRAFDVSSEINRLTEKGYFFAQKQDFHKAFHIAKALLLPTTELIEHTDDSGDCIGGCIDYIIELMALIAKEGMDVNGLPQEIVDFLSTELQNKLYFSYGPYGYDLFDIFQSLSIHLKKTDEYLDFISNQLSKLNPSKDEYEIKQLKIRQIEFLREIGHLDEANKLISKNMDLVEVRKEEVDKLISIQEYQTAKKLIRDGIEIAEAKNHPGTVKEWRKDLLQIAVLEKEIHSIRTISKTLAFDRWFNRMFYNQWKSTFPDDDWKSVIEETIVERTAETTAEYKRLFRNLNNLNHALLRELGPIFIEEKYLDRLLNLVQKVRSLKTVLEYHPFLYPHFPDELIEMYVPMFLKKGETANDRSGYADLVREMKKVIKDIPSGAAQIKAVAQQLREKFPRRPAMLDELSRL